MEVQRLAVLQVDPPEAQRLLAQLQAAQLLLAQRLLGVAFEALEQRPGPVARTGLAHQRPGLGAQRLEAVVGPVEVGLLGRDLTRGGSRQGGDGTGELRGHGPRFAPAGAVNHPPPAGGGGRSVSPCHPL